MTREKRTKRREIRVTTFTNIERTSGLVAGGATDAAKSETSGILGDRQCRWHVRARGLTMCGTVHSRLDATGPARSCVSSHLGDGVTGCRTVTRRFHRCFGTCTRSAYSVFKNGFPFPPGDLETLTAARIRLDDIGNARLTLTLANRDPAWNSGVTCKERINS